MGGAAANLEITWQTILAIGGGLMILLNLGKAAIGLMNPYREMKRRIDTHEKRLDNDHKRLARAEADDKMILRCLFVLLQHERTGNDTGLMDKMIGDLQSHLAERA